MKKIFFVFLLIASLHAQTIHESKDYYLSNDEVFYETKLNNSDFFVLNVEEARILNNYVCDYLDPSYIINKLKSSEKEILSEYTYILVHSKKFKISSFRGRPGNYTLDGYIYTEPENLIFVADQKTKWFDHSEKEKSLIHEMAHALTYYKYGNKMDHDEYWALEVKRIIMCLVCKDEVDKYVNNMLKDYGLKGNLKVY